MNKAQYLYLFLLSFDYNAQIQSLKRNCENCLTMNYYDSEPPLSDRIRYYIVIEYLIVT